MRAGGETTSDGRRSLLRVFIASAVGFDQVKDLRLDRISTIGAANELVPMFITDYNGRFGISRAIGYCKATLCIALEFAKAPGARRFDEPLLSPVNPPSVNR